MKISDLLKKATCVLLSTAMLSGIVASIPAFADNDAQIVTNDFTADQDAYVRKERAGNNFNYEDITSAHGSQYVGKNYKVLNSKYWTSNNQQIVGLIKLPLPSKAEAVEKGYDSYSVIFNIFKNADPGNCPQTYTFYYAADLDWSESSVTWNSISSSIPSGSDRTFFEFSIEKGHAYEFLSDDEKQIKVDVSDKVQQLIDSGARSVTLFIMAKESKNTSLMIHTKESADGRYAPRLRAQSMGYSKNTLKKLIDTCEDLKSSQYTEQSYNSLKTALNAAKVVYNLADAELSEIRSAYVALENAREALVAKDSENIAFGKPTRSNLSKNDSAKVTDGSADTYWAGAFYPSYVDVDLMDTYDITKLVINIPTGKVCYYTVYGSNDGANYDRLYQKRSDTASSAGGDTITFDKAQSYRIIRVYLEYTKGDTRAYLSEIKAYGEKSGKNTEELRQGSLEDILDIKPYSQTDYAKPITKDETVENVYGIIDRTVGAEYRSWFLLEIEENKNNGNDYFEISDKNGKILIKGNEGLSIATGLNYYYKNYLNVHISEQTMQVSMPAKVVSIGKTVRKETPYQIRYAFNYCTLSYSFAFFGEEDWQRENDYLALNGVNVVLDLAGQEATWIKFLMNFGYSFDDAKDWLTGPGYYAWQFMDNMEVFGGPVPDGYVKDRVELARSSQRWKSSLGMQTVLQGYAGMVPTNFNEFRPDVTVIKQGSWNGFSRPDMIATDSATYDEFARLFYEAQEFVYGATTDYYAVDPFHEGGKRPSGLTDDIISKEVLESMLAYDTDAVWIVQGWQSNPTNSLLKGMGQYRQDHVLIVDLIKYPIAPNTKYNKTSYGSTTLDSKEFNNTSWAWCLLANFGGNPSMHGQLEVMVDDILSAQKTSKHMKGIGVISEATYDNPIVYDLLFDLVWADETFDLDTWMKGYLVRRYGAESTNISLAWDIMKDANYNHGVRFTNELFGTKNKTPQSYGKQTIPYGADKLENALRLMLKDYEKFKDNECYRYDLTEMMRQHVSNYAVLKYNELLDARDAKNVAEFKKLKAEFLNAFDVLNEVVSTQKELLGGEWIGKAEDLAENYDDFAMDAFRLNAKTLITTWGSKSGYNNLKDYGWRNYEGIFKDVYTAVWTEYLGRVEANIEKGTPLNNISIDGYFDVYWKWVMTEQSYTRDAKDSPEEVKAVLDRVLAECAVSGKIDPALGDLAAAGTIIAQGKGEGKINGINDTKTDTVYTVIAENGEKVQITLDLLAVFEGSDILLVIDKNGGNCNNIELYISVDGTVWTKCEKVEINDLSSELAVSLKNERVRFVKIEAASDEEISKLAIAELYVYGNRTLADLEMLTEIVKAAEAVNTGSVKESDLRIFKDALDAAKKAVADSAAPDQANSAYWALYDAMGALKKEGKINLALGKPVTAHNDPSGNSQRLTDGDTNTNWDAGRLSATGKPYESTITPGWAVIDLGKEYLLTDIELVFGKNVWHHYEIYVSTDNNSWTKVGEKKDDKLPGTDADKYYLEDVSARYVKISLLDVQVGSDSKRTAIALQEITVLGKEVDASQLSAKVDQAKKLKQENYSAESGKALADALAQAEKVLASQSLSKAEVDAALEALTSALLALEGADKPGNGEENNNGTEEDEGQQNGGNSSGENSGSENPDPNNPAPENPDDKKNGGAGKAALIALAAVLGIALAGGLALLVIKKNKK